MFRQTLEVCVFARAVKLESLCSLLRTGSVVREGESLSAASIENISVSGECKFMEYLIIVQKTDEPDIDNYE
jgi:hypothetical protein